MPGRHRRPRRMLLHVLGLGVALFGLLGAGVAMIESGDPGTRIVTDATTAATLDPSSAPSESPAAAPPTKIIPSSATPPKDKTTTTEDTVTDLINKERVKNGCPVVVTDERLRTAARAHSADMAKQDYFSHTSKDGSTFVDRIARAGYPRESAAAENIAVGYRTAQDVVSGWMKSDGHRRNILNCSSRSTGLGLAYRGSTPYWTQDFGRT